MKKFLEFLNEALSDIDKVLDKMNDGGIESLTPREKELLRKYSKGEDISKFSLDEPKEPIRRIEPVRKIKVPSEYSFKIGDEVRPAKSDQGNLPEEVYYYLRTQKSFLIRNINSNGKIDIGAKTGTGRAYYFNPSRFQLVNSKNQNIKSDIDPFGEDDWSGNDGRLSGNGNSGGIRDGNNNNNNNNNYNNNNNGDDDEVPLKTAFFIVVGETPIAWGLGEGITGMAHNLIDHQYGDMGWAFDGGLCDLYPELRENDFEDLAEGHMEYYGDLDIPEVVLLLRNLGFIAREGDVNVFPAVL